MGDNWDEEDYVRYLKRYPFKLIEDVFPDIKMKWYQKFWINIQCWWILHVRKIWR